MVRTEPFKAEGVARDLIKRIASTEDFEVNEKGGGMIVIENLSRLDILDGVGDCLIDEAGQELNNSSLSTEKLDKWMNNEDYELPDNHGMSSEQASRARKLKEAYYNLKNVEKIGSDLPQTGTVKLAIARTGGMHDHVDFEDLADEEARDAVSNWARNKLFDLEVEVDEDHNITIKGIEETDEF